MYLILLRSPNSLCLISCQEGIASRLKASRDGEFPSGFSSLFPFLIAPDVGKLIYFCFSVYESSFNLFPCRTFVIESNSISLSVVYTAVKCTWKRANILPVFLSIPCDGGSGDLVDILRIAIDTICKFVNANKSISFFTSVYLSEL